MGENNNTLCWQVTC